MNVIVVNTIAQREVNQLREEVSQFVEQVGAFFEGQGLSRTAGRLLALLLVRPNALSLDEMADLVQMSKGSISLNIRMLEGSGLAERVRVAGDRRDYYRVAPDAWTRVIALSIEQAKAMLQLARRGLSALEKDNAEARQRLLELEEFYLFMVGEITGVLKRWQQRMRS